MLTKDSGRQLRRSRDGPPSPTRTVAFTAPEAASPDSKTISPAGKSNSPHSSSPGVFKFSPGSNAGESPLPEVLQERTPPTGSTVVGWGNPNDLKAQLAKTVTSPSGTFQRRSRMVPIPNLAAAASKKPSAFTAELKAPATVDELPQVSRTASTLEALERIVDEKSQSTLEALERLVDERRLSAAATRASTTDDSSAGRSFASSTPSPPAHDGASASHPPVGTLLAEWDAQRRSEHASRLQRAAGKAADKAAARKMIAMAHHEEQHSLPGPFVQGAGEPAPGRMSPWRPPSFTEEDLNEALAPDAPSLGEQEVQKDTPWRCLLLGVHAFLGCDHIVAIL